MTAGPSAQAFSAVLVVSVLAVLGCGEGRTSHGERLRNDEVRAGQSAQAFRMKGIDRDARFELTFGSVDELVSRIVAIEKGAAGSRSGASCIGTLVDRENTSAFALTAAHCVPQPGRGSFDPLRVVISGERAAVRSVLRDSRFQGTALPAAYDAAVLEVSAEHATEMQPPPRATEDGNAIVPGTMLKVASLGKDGRTPELSDARVVSETSLKIVADLDMIGNCRGLSGAPAILEEGRSVRLVGIISSGATDCPANVTLTRLAAVSGALLLREASGLAGCGECIDRLELDAAECKSSTRRCRGEARCTELLECLRKPASHAEPCKSTTFESAASSGLLRCVCANGCASSCPEICAPPAPRDRSHGALGD